MHYATRHGREKNNKSDSTQRLRSSLDLWSSICAGRGVLLIVLASKRDPNGPPKSTKEVCTGTSFPRVAVQDPGRQNGVPRGACVSYFETSWPRDSLPLRPTRPAYSKLPRLSIHCSFYKKIRIMACIRDAFCNILQTCNT